MLSPINTNNSDYPGGFKPFIHLIGRSNYGRLAGSIVGILIVAAALLVAATNPDARFTFGTKTGAPTPPANGYGLATLLTDLSGPDLDHRLSDMKATGTAWVRYDVSWKLIQPTSAAAYDWSNYDRVTKAATAHGFKVLMIIDFAPTWAQAKGCSDGQLCAPADPVAYARFAGAVAQHYKPYGVENYEIWNEPNIAFRFAPKADPALYAHMLKDSYAAIKRVDPKAVVITGGTSPTATDGTNYSPTDFVKALYSHGAAGWFDALSAHPYTSPISPAQSTPTDAWGQLTTVHNLMASHGDGNKQIWVTEFGAPTGGPNNPKDHVTEAFQAQMALDAISMFRGYSWAGPMFWYDYIDAGTSTDTNENFYGLTRADGSHKPSYDAFVQAISPK